MIRRKDVAFLFQLLLLWSIAVIAKTSPHIIFILADDTGWNDVSFHGSPEIPTPNIDALAASGIVLHRYYAAPQCTPSRAALMTGKYPIHLGLQHHVIDAAAPRGLPLSEKTLPQYLKTLGYSTHGVGKWHLGYFTKEYTPTHRGFDSFFGYWNAQIDYFDFTNHETVQNVKGLEETWGVDLHNGTENVRNIRGEYATDVFTNHALKVIENHDKTKPLFLYVSHLACHVGNIYQPLQAPHEHVAKFKYIKNLKRRTFAGVVSKLDESVGKIFEALHERQMLENSIVVFSSDNGGEPNGVRGDMSNNWPLRSIKFRLWDGGVRVPALVWSPLFNLSQPRIERSWMHISDWLPTLYLAAGGEKKNLGGLDGVSLWEKFLHNDQEFRRSEILLNIDSIDGTSALIKDNFKLIWGTYPEHRNYWYGTSGRESLSVRSMDEWVWNHGSVVKDILQETGRWIISSADDWRTGLTVNCGNCHDPRFNYCNLEEQPCLYNLIDDPCEYDNVASVYPELVKFMISRIREYNATALPANFLPVDPRGDPRCHGFMYVTWMDDGFRSACPYA